MTIKEKYIKIRNSQKLDNTWLWEFYKEQGGKMTDVNQFIENFFIVQEPIKLHGHVVGYQRGNRDLGNFFSEMDKKMELITLWGESGNFIKVVE
jgi:hypothetical protein